MDIKKSIYWLKEETIHTFYTDVLDNKELRIIINVQKWCRLIVGVPFPFGV